MEPSIIDVLEKCKYSNSLLKAVLNNPGIDIDKEKLKNPKQPFDSFDAEEII